MRLARFRSYFLIAACIIVLLGTVYYISPLQQRLAWIGAWYAASFSRLATLVVAHKPASKQTDKQEKVSKAKPIVVNREIHAAPIHFEFYTALPNMDMNLVPSKEPETMEIASSKSFAIVSEQELEQEVSQQMKEVSRQNKTKFKVTEQETPKKGVKATAVESNKRLT